MKKKADPRLRKLTKELTEGKLIRARFAPKIQPVDGTKAYLAQGKDAGLLTTKKTSTYVGKIEGSFLWEEQYPFAFVRSVVLPSQYGERTMSVAQACMMLGVRPPTFVSRCSKSAEKAWPKIGGVHRQCSIAEPYPHVFAYRVDPRGRWHVTLFQRSHLLRDEAPLDPPSKEAKKLASELLAEREK